MAPLQRRLRQEDHVSSLVPDQSGETPFDGAERLGLGAKLKFSDPGLSMCQSGSIGTVGLVGKTGQSCPWPSPRRCYGSANTGSVP